MAASISTSSSLTTTMEVKRVRVSVACDACKKRRGKCAGISPCDYCTEHNVSCSFSTKSKKRGPASKHPKLDSSTPSNNTPISKGGAPTPMPTSTSRYTDIKHIEEFMEQFSYLPPFNTSSILTPTTLHHHMARFAVLALMAKSFGDHDRCMEFFGTARQISGQIYDEPSYDSAIAYVLLTCICIMNNDKRAIHFAHLGRSHSKELLQQQHGKEWRAVQLLHQTYVLTLTLDESLATAQKHSVLSNYINTLKKSDQTSNLSGYLIGAASLFLVVDPHKAKREGLLAALHDITYSVEAREKIMQDVERTELLLNANLVACPTRKMGLVLLVKLYRTLVELWSGNYPRACIAVREMIDVAQRPEVAILLRNNTVLATVMPNLVSFGTLQLVIAELLKYFQPNPTHLDDAGACSLSIHPNISAFLGSSQPLYPSSPSHPDVVAHEHSLLLDMGPGSGNSSPNHSDNSANTSPNIATDTSCSPHAPASNNTINATHNTSSNHFSRVMNPSPRTKLPLPEGYMSSYGTHVPLSLPNPLNNHGLRNGHGPLHAHLHPRPRYIIPPTNACSFMQEMPSLKDFYGVQ